MKRELKVNGLYKHFKGHLYKVLDLAEVNSAKVEAQGSLKVLHTEYNEQIEVVITADNKMVVYTDSVNGDTDNLVVYRRVIDGKEIESETFARPEEMFLSEVDHDKYPDVKQKYRLEEVEKE